MKIILFVFPLLLSITAYTQQDKLRNEIAIAAAKIEPQVIAWRRDIHEHPELGNNEIRTSGIVAKYLASLGIEVTTGVAKTGVVGVLRGGKPGPVIALRADMDALPITERTTVPFASKVRTLYNGQEVGVMHACGHDSHVAMLLGVATVLSSMRKDLKGTVKFIFQPAEEGPPPGETGGAEVMVQEGVMNNPKVDVVFGMHINSKLEAGKISYHPGGMLAAVNDMKIVIRGKPSHGAFPWSSIDPIVTAAEIINNLQTVVSRNLNVTENAGVVTIGSIQGGNRPNIIPDSLVMLGTIRSLSPEDEKMMIERVKQIITKTAEANGATAEIALPWTSHYPVTFNDVALTEKMLPSLRKTAGDSNVVLKPATTAAEDFSFYQQKAPGLFIFLGGMPKGEDPKNAPAHHTPDFYIDESGFKLGVEAMANLTVDYMNMVTK